MLLKIEFRVFVAFKKLPTKIENPFINPFQRPLSGNFDPANAFMKLPLILYNHIDSESCL
jgi:hypothetical protein